MAEANVRLLVAGPDRDPAELDPGVWELALDMCRGVFTRDWTGPLVTERELQPPASGRLPEVQVTPLERPAPVSAALAQLLAAA